MFKDLGPNIEMLPRPLLLRGFVAWTPKRYIESRVYNLRSLNTIFIK